MFYLISTTQLHNFQIQWKLWCFVCGIINCCGAILNCLCDFSVRSKATYVAQILGRQNTVTLISCVGIYGMPGEVLAMLLCCFVHIQALGGVTMMPFLVVFYL